MSLNPNEQPYDDTICAFCEKNLPEDVNEADYAFHGFCDRRCCELYESLAFAQNNYGFQGEIRQGFINDDFAYVQFLLKTEIDELGLSDNTSAICINYKYVVCSYNDEVPHIGGSRTVKRWKLMEFYPIPGYSYEEDEYALQNVTGESFHVNETDAFISGLLRFEREKFYSYLDEKTRSVEKAKDNKWRNENAPVF